MKIIGQNKYGRNKGTKILIREDEAMMVFTKEGLRTSMPPALIAGSAEELYEYIQKNNPNLGIFMEVMNYLEKKHGGEIK